jgi:hypothetical protein
MAIWVHISEYAGDRVVEPAGPGNTSRLLRATAADPDTYRLMSGIDERGDTIFNLRQARRLTCEPKALAAASDDIEALAAATAIPELAALLEPAPRRPPHRRLLFSGD